jgi:hypothetical protein
MATEYSILTRSSSFFRSVLASLIVSTFSAMADANMERPASIITPSPTLPRLQASPIHIIYTSNNSTIINTTAIIRRALNTNSKN